MADGAIHKFLRVSLNESTYYCILKLALKQDVRSINVPGCRQFLGEVFQDVLPAPSQCIADLLEVVEDGSVSHNGARWLRNDKARFLRYFGGKLGDCAVKKLFVGFFRHVGTPDRCVCRHDIVWFNYLYLCFHIPPLVRQDRASWTC